MKRKIYDSLIKWKETGVLTPLMVIGARQVGKTHVIREFISKEFKNFVEINLQDAPELVELLEQKISSEERFRIIELYLNIKIDIDNTVIFIDEIQESESIISSLKYFCESNVPYKIICAGSLLGVKLKRFKSSFPVGKVQLLEMNPMDFEEFLLANNDDSLITEIKKCYDNNTPMMEYLHKKLLQLYRLFLCIGGMPKSIINLLDNNNDILKYDSLILKNIIVSYINDMNKYIINKNETVKIERVYQSIPRQLGNNSNKFQYGKISNSARSREYESALEWLLASNMIKRCDAITSMEIPPKAFIKDNTFKLYINDIGLLTSLLEIRHNEIILDRPFIYKGVLAENYVANQLISNRYSLYYWNPSNQTEIDFIIYTQDGLIPIEVKSGDHTSSRSLNNYKEKFKPKYVIKISTRNFGFENGIKSIPLYAVFCIAE